MPLTFHNRSCAMVAARGVIAFSARDGRKEVCCLLPLMILERRVGGVTTPEALSRTFDRHRARIEERASQLYDRDGSDECGEILLADVDLGLR